MSVISIKKSFKNVPVHNIFIKEPKGEESDVKKQLLGGLQSADKTICMVLEQGLTDELAEALTIVSARKYLIVPEINADKYKKLAGGIIAREVDRIKGNYAIIDEKILFCFDKSLNGYVISDKGAVNFVYNLFLKEFWEYGKMEFINEKAPCAERTFDVPPIYGNSSVLIDESFEEQSPVERLVNNADFLVCKGSAYKSADTVYLNNLRDNVNYVKSVVNSSVYYTPDMPCSILGKNGQYYLLNFDAATYSSLPEKGKGRLFAVKCEKPKFSEVYKFFGHKTVEELLGKDVLDVGGSKLTIIESEEVNRTINTDLCQKFEYLKMDEETFVARIEAKNPDIFSVDKLVAEVTFKVNIEMVKRTINNKASVYKEYESVRKRCEQAKIQLVAFCRKTHNDKLAEEVQKVEIRFETIEEYSALENKFADFAERANSFDERGDIDESLAEVSNKNKKRPQLPQFQRETLSMNLPAFGTLYQAGSRYEYVLNSEESLTGAIKEMKAAAINDVLYLTEQK